MKLDDAGINEIIESENSGWSPDRPNDYDTELTLYTVGMNGMRKIKISSADTVAKEYLMNKGWSESSVTASNITHDSITWNVSYADGKTLKIYECNKNSDGSMAYNLIDSTMLTAINASYTISGLKELTEYYAVLADEYNREIYTVTAKTQAGQGTGNLTLTDAMRNAGVTITTINGTQYYDYSVPINQMIWNNAQLCIQHRAQYTDEWYIPDSIEFALNMKKLYDSMDWFVDMDGSGAPWDIKLQNRWEEQFPGIPYLGLREQFVLNGQLQHAEGVGNIAFGYWARALGYGPETIYYGAGWAQIGGTKTLDSLLDERLAEGPLYGDNADDHEWVNQGIQWYDSEHPNDPYVVNTNPAKVYSEVEEAVKIAIRMILESMVILCYTIMKVVCGDGK